MQNQTEQKAIFSLYNANPNFLDEEINEIMVSSQQKKKKVHYEEQYIKDFTKYVSIKNKEKEKMDIDNYFTLKNHKDH